MRLAIDMIMINMKDQLESWVVHRSVKQLQDFGHFTRAWTTVDINKEFLQMPPTG